MNRRLLISSLLIVLGLSSGTATSWARGNHEIYRGIELRNFRECPYEIIDQVIDFVEELKETPVIKITVPAFEELDTGSCYNSSNFFVYTKQTLQTYNLEGYHDAGFEEGKRWIRSKKTPDVLSNIAPHGFFLVQMVSGSMILTGRNQFFADITGKKDLLPTREISDIANRVAYQQCWNSAPALDGSLSINVISEKAVDISFNTDYNGESICALTKFEGVWKKTLPGMTIVKTYGGDSVTILGEPALTMEDVEAIAVMHHHEEIMKFPGLIPGDLVIQILSPTEVTTSSNVSSQMVAPAEDIHHLMKLSGIWTKTLPTPIMVTTDSGYSVEVLGVPSITKSDVELIVPAYAGAEFMQPFNPNHITGIVIRVISSGHVIVSSDNFETEVNFYKKDGLWATYFRNGPKTGEFTEIPIIDLRQYSIGDLIDP